MRRYSVWALVAVGALSTLSCIDQRTGPTPVASESAVAGRSGKAALAACPSLAEVQAQAQLVFGAKNPNFNAVRGKIDLIDKAMAKGNGAQAVDHAFKTVDFVLGQFNAGGGVSGTPSQVADLINGLFCVAGLDITISNPAAMTLVNPAPITQVITNADKTAGVSLPPNALAEPAIVEFTLIPESLYPVAGTGPLGTKLDQYPGFFDISVSSASHAALVMPVVVGVCPKPGIAAEVRARLRLGHQRASGFELTPAADAAFLECPAAAGGFTAGIGGMVSEFSPFAAVDPVAFLNSMVGPACLSISAPWGTGLAPSCRPVVVTRTNIGTLLSGVPVAWSVTLGDGIIVARLTTTCTPSAPTAATTTDPYGRVSICWQLGTTPGTNNNAVTATPSAGGSAPPGVTFSPAVVTVAASALKRAVKVTTTCIDSTANGLDRNPCSASAVDLTTGAALGSVPVNYSPTPVNTGGTYVATASFDETPLYAAASALPVSFHVYTNTPPTLLTPTEGEYIKQWAVAPFCSATFGWQIQYDWTDVPGAVSYRIYATGAGAPIPVLNNVVVTGSSYTLTSCSGYVIPQYQLGWVWHVTAVMPDGTLLTSATGTYNYTPRNQP